MSEAGKIFQACVSAVNDAQGQGMASPEYIVATVLKTVAEVTPSPRTVDELTRILNGERVDGVGTGLTEDGEVTEAKCDSLGVVTNTYQHGFHDRLQVLQLANGNPVIAEEAWAWLIKPEAEASDVRS